MVVRDHGHAQYRVQSPRAPICCVIPAPRLISKENGRRRGWKTAYFPEESNHGPDCGFESGQFIKIEANF